MCTPSNTWFLGPTTRIRLQKTASRSIQTFCRAHRYICLHPDKHTYTGRQADYETCNMCSSRPHLCKSLFTEENDSKQKHSSESINTNKAKTAKTATKSITVVDTWNYIVINLHQGVVSCKEMKTALLVGGLMSTTSGSMPKISFYICLALAQ